ncbi:MAG: DUF2461 domain-containing protein [Chitinophagaceae bacterium]|jgi:uncharacterized protein (TIGR02453 family)|nr:DUF2461 domain-containing protein [Chitinophagaceae bacterium]MBP6045874.1 DUF2461 domain-containing protein [Ferruginibacter sp.]NMD28292.1 DUF2461 domain-containing protein [Bacteroidota bacterium]MBK7088876.1 DUF2461 domain-containing protein [Chitinophagaceae bacterium]MBK7347936.1 DUF2461 domain-containing protein [Chitinophagaceae bacterium]
MLQQSTLRFLKQLRSNNNKPWFDNHRQEYEKVKEDFINLVQQVLDNAARFDANLQNLQHKNCVFRINRDVRFSADKRPYKNNLAAYFNKDGKKGEGAGYYLHIEPGKSFIGVGIWQPLPEVLAKIRQEIDYNLPGFKLLLKNAKFKKHFFNGLVTENKLSRPPKGYNDDNPAIEWIKLKSFIVTCTISDADIVKKTFSKQVADVFGAALPLVNFINKALD